MDISNIKANLSAVKTTSDTSSKSVIAANTKIREILIDVRLASGKLLDLETRINTNNTQRISKDEEIKGQITSIENSFNDKIKTADSAFKTATEGLDKKITETNTKITEVNLDLSDEDLKLDKIKITESNNKITDLKTLYIDENNKLKIEKRIESIESTVKLI